MPPRPGMLQRSITPRDAGRFVSRALRLLLAGCALGYIAVFIAIAMFRMRCPFDLEWMEGGSVDMVRRVLAGQPLYARPALEYTPFAYTPLYYYLAAVAARLTEAGYTPLRLVSLLATLGNFWLIGALVRRETGRAEAGLAAAGLFAATFPLSGAWFDLARVDSLLLFFSLATLCALRFGRSRRALAGAGLLFTLAFLTKQTACVMFAPLAAWALVRHRRRALWLAGAALGLSGAAAAALNYLNGGWFTYYAFKVPSGYALEKGMIVDFWRLDIVRPLPLAAPGAAAALVAMAFGRDRLKFLFYLLAAEGFVGAAWYSRILSGGFVNVLVPAHAAIAILCGLAFGWWGGGALCDSPRRESPAPPEAEASGPAKGWPKLKRPLWARWLLEIAVCGLLLFQYHALRYSLAGQLPQRRDWWAAEELVRKMRAIPGEVYLPLHGGLPSLAGKKSYAHARALYDVIRGDPAGEGRRLEADLARALAAGRFAAVFADTPSIYFAMFMDERRYERKENIFDQPQALWPRTGFQTRPDVIYMARKNPHPAQGQ